MFVGTWCERKKKGGKEGLVGKAVQKRGERDKSVTVSRNEKKVDWKKEKKRLELCTK